MYLERDGVLLREATEKELMNVVTYYHHETVRVGGIDDDLIVRLPSLVHHLADSLRSCISPSVESVLFAHAYEGFCEDLARQNTVAHLFQLQLGFRRCRI